MNFSVSTRGLTAVQSITQTEYIYPRPNNKTHSNFFIELRFSDGTSLSFVAESALPPVTSYRKEPRSVL